MKIRNVELDFDFNDADDMERLENAIEKTQIALEKISEVQAKSENFDEIEEIKERRVYIPRMTHPWKSKSFEDFVKTQKHRLENVA